MSGCAKPTESELAILAALWQLGSATVPQVHDALGGKGQYTTTLKLMQIMIDKGLLKRERAGRGHVYRPAVPQQRTQTRLVGDLMKRAFGGSVRALLLAALSSERTSPEEIAALRKLIDEAEQAAKEK